MVEPQTGDIVANADFRKGGGVAGFWQCRIFTPDSEQAAQKETFVCLQAGKLEFCKYRVLKEVSTQRPETGRFEGKTKEENPVKFKFTQ